MTASNEKMANGGGAIGGLSLVVADRVVRHMLDRVRRMEPHRWSARCIMHDDRDNSLSVWVENGMLCFKCHSGCSPKAITDTLAERFPEYSSILGRAKSESLMEEKIEIKEDAIDWYANYTGVAKEVLRGLPIAFTGTEIIFRFPGIDRYKVRFKGQKGAVWRGTGHTPDLWPLPPERIGEDIVITEGESDCVVARSLGFEAYAITKGAATGLSTAVLVALRRRGARRVVVVMDADQAGRQAASKLVIAARQAGLAAIDLDLVAEGLVEPLWGQKDLRDAYKAGKGSEIVEAIRHMLYRADEARPIAPRPLSDIMQEEVTTDYIVQGFLRAGGSAILAGEPKLGKSQLSLDMALAVARGEPFCGMQVKRGRVIYYALEDGEDIVRDRVRARGLDRADDLYVGIISPVAGDNVAILEEHIDLIQPSLVIIDTLRATAVGGGKNENEAGFADSIYRVAKLARERGVAVVVVHHTIKAPSGNPVTDARGTSAIAGAVDVVIGLYRSDKGARLVWRGRYGCGELSLGQHTNGSFNYLSSVPQASTGGEDYARRLEERLNRYYEACVKYADPSGRVDVKKVVLAMWGMRDGRYPDGAWDKTYKALDELVRRQRLRKRERQYYVAQAEASRGPASVPTEEVNQQPTGETRELVEARETREALEQGESSIFAVDGGGGGERDAQPPQPSQEPKTTTDMKKRSLLLEVKEAISGLGRKEGTLAHKVASLVRTAHSALANRREEEAAKALFDAYQMMLEEGDRTSADDYREALFALDIGLFMFAFGQANEDERKLGWLLWDRRQEIPCDLYDYFGAVKKYLDLVRDGVYRHIALEEVIAATDYGKLREILASHVAEERKRDTGRHR